MLHYLSIVIIRAGTGNCTSIPFRGFGRWNMAQVDRDLSLGRQVNRAQAEASKGPLTPLHCERPLFVPVNEVRGPIASIIFDPCSDPHVVSFRVKSDGSFSHVLLGARHRYYSCCLINCWLNPDESIALLAPVHPAMELSIPILASSWQ